MPWHAPKKKNLGDFDRMKAYCTVARWCSCLSDKFCCFLCVCFWYTLLVVSMGILPWEIRVAFFPEESQLHQSRATQP